MTLDIEKDSSTTKASRSKRSVPEVIYPQILVLIDYAKFQLEKNILYHHCKLFKPSIMYNMCSNTGFMTATCMVFWNIYCLSGTALI